MVGRGCILPVILVLIGLCASALAVGAEPGDLYANASAAPQPSRWASPDRSPKPTHSRPVDTGPLVIKGPQSPRAALSSSDTGATNGRIALIVHDSIYEAVEQSIVELTWDLAAAGWSSVVCRYVSGAAESVRGYLGDLYLSPDGLRGAILVGDIPYIIYEMMQTWNNGASYEYEDFPCDIFYMDLDGVWSDSLTDRQVLPGNGKYDTRSGGLGLEIWVSRIKTGNLGMLGAETDLVTSYINRARQFRMTPLLTDQYAVAYDDDDWANMTSGDRSALESVFGAGNCVGIGAAEATTAADFKCNRLPRSTRWYLVRSHGYPGGHGFYRNSRATFEYVSTSDYRATAPPASFFSLFVCGGCDYTASNYLGGVIAFNPASSAIFSIGSTKTGGMWADSYFYSLMGQGKCIGEAFRLWFNQMQITYAPQAPRWWYGTVMIGDPSLNPNPSVYPVYRRLTTSVAPVGAGAVSPSAGDHYYPDGQIVPISAAPAPGCNFDYWDGPVADPYSPSTTVNLSSDVTVTAHMSPATIGEAKRLPDGASVQLVAKVVTCVDADWFYVEEENRTCGIRVHMVSHGLAVGDIATIAGLMRTDENTERYIAASAVSGSGKSAIAPVCLALRSLGGKDWAYDASTGAGQKGVPGCFGVNNVGLLVRVAGAVVSLDSGGFCVSDLVSQVKVLTPSWLNAQVGDRAVAVTGVVSLEVSGGLVRPVLLVRSQADIVSF